MFGSGSVGRCGVAFTAVCGRLVQVSVSLLEFCRTFAVLGRLYLRKSLISGGRYWDRTSGPCRVKAVLYR